MGLDPPTPFGQPGTVNSAEGKSLRSAQRRCRRLCAVWAALAVACLPALAAEGLETAPAKVPLRVIYFGHPQSARAKDFMAFLEQHFTRVGQGDLDAFREPDAAGYDVTILDYDEVKVVGDHIEWPKKIVSKQYSHPTVTIGATGALVCDRLGLKTGYL